MPMLPADDYQPNERLRSLGIDAYPAFGGEAVGASAEESWVRNPTGSLLRELRRQSREPAPVGIGAEFGTDALGPAVESAPMLDAETANTRYGIKGELTFDRDTPEQTASDLHDLKREELRRRNVMSRARGGFGETAASFGAGLAASIADPLNIASAFIPAVGPARMAVWANRVGVTAARTSRGAIEGAVGAALLEPLVYGVARSEQADYDATDSLLNLAFGTVLGGGLHAGLGKVGDLIQQRRMAEPLLRDSVAAVVEGRPVQVDPIIAYHGSPHEFTAFDLSRVGTGEGHQAYGHGLYFAENIETARTYQKEVLDTAYFKKVNDRQSTIAKELEQYKIPGRYRDFNDPRGYELADEYDRLMGEKLGKTGRMYKVAIGAEREAFLDWDKPLSEQSSKVQEALVRLTELEKKRFPKDYLKLEGPGGRTGQSLYRDLAAAITEQKKGNVDLNRPDREASAMLKEAGIPGVKYLDQGSRPTGLRDLAELKTKVAEAERRLVEMKAEDHPGASEQARQIGLMQARVAEMESIKETRNFVLFDDKLVNIIPDAPPSAPRTADSTAIRPDEKPSVDAVDAIVNREPVKAAPRAEGAAPLGPKAAEAQAELDSVMQQIEATKPVKAEPEVKSDAEPAPDPLLDRAESDAKAYERAAFCLGRNTP